MNGPVYKELARLTRKGDRATLHIVQKDTPITPYVVCWNFDGKSWDWGTYCVTYEEAQEVFAMKARDHGFLIQ